MCRFLSFLSRSLVTMRCVRVWVVYPTMPQSLWLAMGPEANCIVQVTVEVKAAGTNFFDILMVKGQYQV